MHIKDFTAILARVAGLSILTTDVAFTQAISTLLGAHAPSILAALGLLSTLAADMIRIQAVPAQSRPTLLEPPVTPESHTD